MTKFYKSTSLMVILLLLFSLNYAMAQERTVSGTVLSQEDQTPLPGVNILVKGTSSGTVTDIDGKYQLTVPENAVIVFSFIGFTGEEVIVGNRSTIDVQLVSDIRSLSEVVVVGYGTQEKKEITAAVQSLNPEDFNRGNVNSPAQLLQGKVPGLSIYNKGGNPNSGATIRLRGISTVGANSSPLVVIDGVIGASLDNVDPNDIASIDILKDGSSAAIYGSRGSAGVILVTTKSGSRTGGVKVEYNGFVAAATLARRLEILDAQGFIAAGGNDLGSETDWVGEVTRTGLTHVHNVSLSGGSEKTTYRLSTNFRDVNGILKKSGFDQVNARANINHRAINDKLQINLNFSLTNRESNFSFNEAMRYAVLFNPTAPIFNDQGNYFQAILFDNYNPASILELNQNLGKRREINYNAKVDYSLLDNLVLTANYAQQFTNNMLGQYYPRTSLFRGFDRTGLARREMNDNEFTLFETYGTYTANISNVNLSATAGYSFQQTNFESFFVQAGNFPNDLLGFNALEFSRDLTRGGLLSIGSDASPDERIIAQFARVNLSFDGGIFLNASVRREGSSKLGVDNQWGIFPAVGVGVDLNRYLNLSAFDQLKFRAGYGVTGSLPRDNGLSQDRFNFNYQGGIGQTSFARAGNPDLKWEQKQELNVGFDMSSSNGKLNGSLDFYTRNIKDFVLELDVDAAVFGAPRQFQNAGALRTNGIEAALGYVIDVGDLSWSPGIVLSSYKTILKDFIIAEQTRANLGSPGQNGTNLILTRVGEEIGQIWGPRFSGNVDENGVPIMVDINGDGQLITAQGSALAEDGDFEVLGRGIPTLELGWTNQLTYKNWDLNVFFRGAFGHSLVNSFRAFYEPRIPGQINSYNASNTSLARDDIQSAQFSSYYVERADFLRLDNATLGYNFITPQGAAFNNIRIYTSVENAFVITGYKGLDPDPSLQDTENGDVLAPGIDRRNNYFTARTFTFGVNFGF